jgi:exosome complex exonuclease RRP6
MDARGPLADLDDAPLARRGCSAMDEPEKVRGREDAASGHEAGGAEEAGDGFQLVIHGKKKKRAASGQDCRTAGSGFGAGAGPVRALTREKGDAPAPGAKAKVPCHDPSIPRPQDVYKIRVDNYKPFEHVWLERNEDGTRHVHPLVSDTLSCCYFSMF